MPFTKDDLNINRQGRPVGSLNKNTGHIKDLIFDLYNSNLAHIKSDFNNLTLEQRLQLNKDLLPYLLSKERFNASSTNDITDNEIVVKIVSAY
jgi:hypothetical protein